MGVGASWSLPQGFASHLCSQNPRQRAEPRCFAGEDAGHGFFWLGEQWVLEVGEEVFRGSEWTVLLRRSQLQGGLHEAFGQSIKFVGSGRQFLV